MTAFQVIAAVLTVSALFAYVNHRWIRLPASIALMALSLAFSLVLLVLDRLGWVSAVGIAHSVLDRIQLGETLLHGMLGALLFAGALHVDLNSLRSELASVLALAVVGTVLSTVLVAMGIYAASRLVGAQLDFVHCLAFGALISPTDPVAVLGMLKSARVSNRLATQIAGESLFNDGVGVVIFVTVLGAVENEGSATFTSVLVLFVREAIGGAVFGVVTGWIAFRALRSIDHYQTELLITLALVLGGYALAESIHVSAPIAAVVAGLVIGNMGRAHAMSDVTRDHLDKFWSVVDDVLNAVLFVLVGFELIRISLQAVALALGAIAVITVLGARFISVAAPLTVIWRWRKSERGELGVLTWGGLRGGISVALALSLPADPERDLVVSTTYFVVVFSVLVQGLTLGRVARRLCVCDVPSAAPAEP